MLDSYFTYNINIFNFGELGLQFCKLFLSIINLTNSFPHIKLYLGLFYMRKDG